VRAPRLGHHGNAADLVAVSVARRLLIVGLVLAPLVARADEPPKKVDEDPEPKLSLPTEADRLAWTRSGFRLALGLVDGEFSGANGAPSGRLFGAFLRAGLRLDESWSLMTSFQYASVSRTNQLSGLRFAGTIDPTYHPAPGLAISVGLGFGGIVEGSTGRPDATPLPSTLDTSYTFPNARTPVASCSGVGVAGIALEVDAQWTGCVDDTGRVEPDSGTAIVRRQWWGHTAVTLAWGIQWR